VLLIWLYGLAYYLTQNMQSKPFLFYTNSMILDTTQETNEVSKIHLIGNIIPPQWYKTIQKQDSSNGKVKPKAHLLAINNLADIVYWYRNIVIRDEVTGEVTEIKKRFKSDLLQRSYAAMIETFGCSDTDCREAVAFLESVGLIKRVFRTIRIADVNVGNIMFIQIFPQMVEKATIGKEVLQPIKIEKEKVSANESKGVDNPKDSYTSNEDSPINELPTPLSLNSGIGVSQMRDYTYTTTKITTETTTEKKEEERERASDFSAIKNFKDFSSQETENANNIADENDFASIPVQYSKDTNTDYKAYKEQQQQSRLKRINTNTSVQFPGVFDKQLETMPENSSKIEFEKQINIAMGLWEDVLTNTGMKYKPSFEKEKQINTLCKFDIGFVIDRLEMCLEKKWGQIVWEDITEKYNIWKSKNTTTQTFKATKTFLSKKPKTNMGYEKDGMVNGIYYADHDTNNESYDPRTNPEDKQYHYAFDRRSEMYLDDTVGKQTKYQWWESKFGDNDY